MNLSALKLSVIPHSFNPTSEEPALLFVAIIYRCSLNASKTCNHEATVCKDDWTHSLIKTWMCRMAAAFSKTAHPTNVWVIKVTLRNPKPKIKQIAREMLIVRLFSAFFMKTSLRASDWQRLMSVNVDTMIAKQTLSLPWMWKSVEFINT